MRSPVADMTAFTKLRKSLALLSVALLGGCDWVVLRPSGDIAVRQGALVVQATALMLLIIVPVIMLTLLFAWRYRQSNAKATYQPDWDHSVQLELVIWAAPLLIIITLGALTWITTHTLDPYRSLDRIDARRGIPLEVEPLTIEVVALDWRWLFIYPEQGIAVVNEAAAPVDRPIRFLITASSVMNSFFVPALAGQIYAMPGMETQLHAVINRVGVYQGFSANFSGAGFSSMKFDFRGVAAPDFDAWVQQAKSGGTTLDRATYLALEKPSERGPVRRYASVAPGLYEAIVNRCVAPGTMCIRQMMALDEQRNGAQWSGLAGLGAVCRADDPVGAPWAAAPVRIERPQGLAIAWPAPPGEQGTRQRPFVPRERPQAAANSRRRPPRGLSRLGSGPASTQEPRSVR
jgi:cytochrome o ubiquinol oxidase subunit 2